eukprot:6173053-Pleurochrysis_carterae.AAC.7
MKSPALAVASFTRMMLTTRSMRMLSTGALCGASRTRLVCILFRCALDALSKPSVLRCALMPCEACARFVRFRAKSRGSACARAQYVFASHRSTIMPTFLHTMLRSRTFCNVGKALIHLYCVRLRTFSCAPARSCMHSGAKRRDSCIFFWVSQGAVHGWLVDAFQSPGFSCGSLDPQGPAAAALVKLVARQPALSTSEFQSIVSDFSRTCRGKLAPNALDRYAGL